MRSTGAEFFPVALLQIGEGEVFNRLEALYRHQSIHRCMRVFADHRFST